MPTKIEKWGVALPQKINTDEVFVQKVKPFGNAGHVGVPLEFVNWKVLIIPYKQPERVSK